jgi:hypothetical protein
VGELVEQSARLARRDSHWLYRAAAALSLLECGREDEAQDLALAEDPHAAPWDWHWSWTMVIWADVCCRLELTARAAELYELLLPFAGQMAGTGASAWGSVASALGLLATVLERDGVPEEHFQAGAAIEERFGAPLLAARTHVAWARSLIARGTPEDIRRAEAMLARSEEMAGRLGSGLVGQEIERCRVGLTGIGG